MKNTLKSILVKNQDFILNLKIISRPIHLEETGNYVITGPRRAGKTYALYQIIQGLIQSGMSKNGFVFINFEDERLLEFETAHFDLILQAYSELFEGTPVIFLDEIQNIPHWEKFARRLADQNYRVFITGSNANMLSREIAGTLGGRYFEMEVLPLSFKEFLVFNGIELDKNWEFSNDKFKLVRYLSEYFYFGGFPEVLKYENKRSYLSSLLQKVMYGDIVGRYQIRNRRSIELLTKKIAENTGDATAFNRLKNIVQSTGERIATQTVIEYCEYMRDGYMLFMVNNFTSKFSERETKHKFYFIDNGILNLYQSLNIESQLLENIVYLQLYREYGNTVFYYKNKYETEFYVPSEKLLVQVAYHLDNNETMHREIRSFIKASENLEVDKFLLVTYNEEEDTIREFDIEINVIPLLKFLLL
jgi:hypothetical protein